MKIIEETASTAVSLKHLNVEILARKVCDILNVELFFGI